MIEPKDFPQCFFPKIPNFTEKPISKLIGIDSEAYKSGKPFMYCTSLGDCIRPESLLRRLFQKKYIYANFVFYNMKYDSGAILHPLKREVLSELWSESEVTHNEYHFKYIPHKALKITRLDHGAKSKHNPYVMFWDIAQFYHSSLDNAAKKYLGEAKLEIETKAFTYRYVRENWQKIKKYCVRDAALTQRLAVYFVKALKKFDVEVSTMYSCASIANKYFSLNSKICHTQNMWKNNKEAFSYGVEAYAGGKFEATHRGSFYGYMYDLKSAYPHEMRNLLDLSKCKYSLVNYYDPESTYSFIRCLIHNNKGLPIPCGAKLKNGIRIYPAGSFYTTITKAEYIWLTERGIRVDVFSALNFYYYARPSYPYRKCVNNLYKIKDSVDKNKDKMRYMVTKILMNSFYGKMVQCTALKDGRFKFGGSFNQFYGAIITANTRIAITNIQWDFPDHCLAVHTDSAIVTKKLPKKYLSTKLGGLDFETEGEGLIIGCGQYDLGDKMGTRSVRFSESWRSYLSRPENANLTELVFPQLHVTSWVEAMAKGFNHYHKINVFETVEKKINLNVDQKREWPQNTTASDLLKNLQDSKPVFFTNKIYPHWKKP